jgi:hypothetical protein
MYFMVNTVNYAMRSQSSFRDRYCGPLTSLRTQNASSRLLGRSTAFQRDCCASEKENPVGDTDRAVCFKGFSDPNVVAEKILRSLFLATFQTITFP